MLRAVQHHRIIAQGRLTHRRQPIDTPTETAYQGLYPPFPCAAELKWRASRPTHDGIGGAWGVSRGETEEPGLPEGLTHHLDSVNQAAYPTTDPSHRHSGGTGTHEGQAFITAD